MDIKQFLEICFKNESEYLGVNGFGSLPAELLKKPEIKEMLLQCDEFQDVDDLFIVDHLTFGINTYKSWKLADVDEAGSKVVSTNTYLLYEKTKFKKAVFLYSIGLTPGMYDESELFQPVKDDLLTYSAMPKDLKSQKAITVFFSPEDIQDNPEKIEELKTKLQKAIENPKKYEPKKKYGVMLRGMFNVDGTEIVGRKVIVEL